MNGLFDVLLFIVFASLVVFALFAGFSIFMFLLRRLYQALAGQAVTGDGGLKDDRDLLQTVPEEERRLLVRKALSGEKIDEGNYAAKVAAAARVTYADISKRRRNPALQLIIVVSMVGLSVLRDESATPGLWLGLLLLLWVVSSQIWSLRTLKKLRSTAAVNKWESRARVPDRP